MLCFGFGSYRHPDHVRYPGGERGRHSPHGLLSGDLASVQVGHGAVTRDIAHAGLHAPRVEQLRTTRNDSTGLMLAASHRLSVGYRARYAVLCEGLLIQIGAAVFRAGFRTPSRCCRCHSASGNTVA